MEESTIYERLNSNVSVSPTCFVLLSGLADHFLSFSSVSVYPFFFLSKIKKPFEYPNLFLYIKAFTLYHRCLTLSDYRNHEKSTFANSEDPDEMQHNA